MKEFPVSETAMIRLKAMVRPILYAVVLKQLEDSSDPFHVAEFMFAVISLQQTQHSVIPDREAAFIKIFMLPAKS